MSIAHEQDIIALCNASRNFRESVNQYWLATNPGELENQIDLTPDQAEESVTEAFRTLELAEYRVRRSLDKVAKA